MTKAPTLNIDRRSLFAAAAASTALAASNGALANPDGTVYEPRGWVGRHKRLPILDLESQQDYLEGFRIWVNSDVNQAANDRIDQIMRARGIDPKADLPLEQILAQLKDDPIVTLMPAAWLRVQQLMWRTLDDHFHAHQDQYLTEMEAEDKRGPGALELNPKMDVPEYTAREIHMQPGGYVGNMFAGQLYHHGTNGFFNGKNYQDETHDARAAAVLTPPDGKVKRVLEFGTGIGQLPMALKRRFPEAEVWADDVAGPMLRYAHMRTAQMGVDVRYVQGLSEKSQFPDNHFDMVTNNLLIHEVPAQQIKDIAAEAYRTLRPGGVFYPLDSYSGDQPRNTALSKYAAWRSYRWNHEVWWMEYYGLDLAQAMRDVGFKVDENGPKGRGDTTRNVVGYKI